MIQLIESLESNPLQGVAIGDGFYKIRLAIRSKGKGKSGGARIITLVKIIEQQVILAAIYDKNEQASISDKELKKIAEIIKNKLK